MKAAMRLGIEERKLHLLSRRRAIGLFASAAVSARVGQASIVRGSTSLALAEVIKRHTRARGGAARLDTVHALSTKVEISEKGSTLQARYSCNDSPAWRIDVYAGGRHVFCEGLDQIGPWLWPGDE